MQVVVFLDQRFVRTPDGQVWTKGPGSHSFFRRYLQVFGGVRVAARVREVENASPRWQQASGPAVSFAALPSYLGPWEYLRCSRQVARAAMAAVGPSDAVIFRVPAQVVAPVEKWLRRTGRPFGVEVVGDPHDAYGPAALRHPLRPVLRRVFRSRLRRQCQAACAAAYVTAAALQRRYPPAAGAFRTSYASAELPAEAFLTHSRRFTKEQQPWRLVTIGSLQSIYKGTDVLLDAVARCLRAGIALEMEIVGDGAERPWLQQEAGRLGLAEQVRFLAQVPPGDGVRRVLDRADLFVLPSRTEGLPRAMLEAMARALPCIGSAVGGIPELLPSDALVPPGDVAALARKIAQFVNDAARMSSTSGQNLAKACEYRDEILQQRRDHFYDHVRLKTEVWLRQHGRQRQPRPENLLNGFPGCRSAGESTS